MAFPMIGFITFVIGFAILWLGIKFLAGPIGKVDEPSWLRSAIWAIVIWFVSYVVLMFVTAWYLG